MTPAQGLLTEFRKDGEKVKALREALNVPIIQEAFSVLNQAGPQNAQPLSNTTDTFAVMEYGYVLGYFNRANRLNDLATPIADRPIIPQDYAPGN